MLLIFSASCVLTSFENTLFLCSHFSDCAEDQSLLSLWKMDIAEQTPRGNNSSKLMVGGSSCPELLQDGDQGLGLAKFDNVNIIQVVPPGAFPVQTSSHPDRLVGRSLSLAAHLGLARQMLDLNDYTVGSQCRKSIKIPSSLETGALITHSQVFKGGMEPSTQSKASPALGLSIPEVSGCLQGMFSEHPEWVAGSLCCLFGGV